MLIPREVTRLSLLLGTCSSPPRLSPKEPQMSSDEDTPIQPKRHQPTELEDEQKKFLQLKLFCLEKARENRKLRSEGHASVSDIPEAVQWVIDAMMRALEFFLWVSD